MVKTMVTPWPSLSCKRWCRAIEWEDRQRRIDDGAQDTDIAGVGAFAGEVELTEELAESLLHVGLEFARQRFAGIDGRRGNIALSEQIAAVDQAHDEQIGIVAG